MSQKTKQTGSNLPLGFLEFEFSHSLGHKRKFGKTGYDNIDDMARMWAENFAHAESASRDSLIQYEGRSGGAHGHNYFRTNPAVASGLVLTVRYGRSPGAENGRPLEHVEGLFWKIDDDYLQSLNDK